MFWRQIKETTTNTVSTNSHLQSQLFYSSSWSFYFRLKNLRLQGQSESANRLLCIMKSAEYLIEYDDISFFLFRSNSKNILQTTTQLLWTEPTWSVNQITGITSQRPNKTMTTLDIRNTTLTKDKTVKKLLTNLTNLHRVETFVFWYSVNYYIIIIIHYKKIYKSYLPSFSLAVGGEYICMEISLTTGHERQGSRCSDAELLTYISVNDGTGFQHFADHKSFYFFIFVIYFLVIFFFSFLFLPAIHACLPVIAWLNNLTIF